MIGPSSSHTSGAARIGEAARTLFGMEPEWIKINVEQIFDKTYKGHVTDFALVSSLLGIKTDDPRMKESLSIAAQRNIHVEFVEDEAAVDHPNTARIMIGRGREQMELVGISIGGGKVSITELNGFELRLSGNHPAVLIVHNDRYGAIASVTDIFAKHEI